MTTAAFLADIARMLKSQGTLVISTPNALHTGSVSRAAPNPFHIREYTPGQFRDLLLTRFSNVALLGQRVSPSFGACPYWDEGPGTRSWKTMLRGIPWKLQLRARPTFLVSLAKRLRGHRDLYPKEDEFAFVSSGIERCHGLIAVCREPVP